MKLITKIDSIPNVAVTEYDADYGDVTVEMSQTDGDYVQSLFKFMRLHCNKHCSIEIRYTNHDHLIQYDYGISQPILYFIAVKLFNDLAIERFLAYHILNGYI